MNADNVMYEKLLNEALLNLSTLEDTLQSSNIFLNKLSTRQKIHCHQIWMFGTSYLLQFLAPQEHL